MAAALVNHALYNVFRTADEPRIEATVENHKAKIEELREILPTVTGRQKQGVQGLIEMCERSIANVAADTVRWNGLYVLLCEAVVKSLYRASDERMATARMAFAEAFEAIPDVDAQDK